MLLLPAERQAQEFQQSTLWLWIAAVVAIGKVPDGLNFLLNLFLELGAEAVGYL